MTRKEAREHMDMLIAHKDKAIETHPYFKRCDNCIHSEEQDGCSCYECVKNMADNFEAQPTSDDDIIKALKAVRTIHNGNYAPQIDEAIRRLKAQPSEDYDYKALWEQARWERDVALEQLEQLGYSLGEKIRTDEDCISRSELLRHQHIIYDDDGEGYKAVYVKDIKALPSVTPTDADIREAYIKGYDYGVKDWFKSKTQPSEDAISRTEAIKEINKCHITSGVTNQGTWNECVDSIIRTIADMPSVTPQPKMGRWIYGEDNLETGRDGWFCNQCGHFEFWDYSSDMESAKLNLPNVCPNCGVEMEGTE